MLKQSFFYLIASILVILFGAYAHRLLLYIDMFYLYLNYKLHPIFAYFELTGIIQKVIILTLIPVIITAIPALIYRLIKGKTMPHFIAITWCLWLIIVLSAVLIH